MTKHQQYELLKGMAETLDIQMTEMLMHALYDDSLDGIAVPLSETDRLLLNQALMGLHQAAVHIRKFLHDTTTGRSWRNKT